MQKKVRKEILRFVLASADSGSSWQPPIGRTLELGFRRKLWLSCVLSRAYCKRRVEFFCALVTLSHPEYRFSWPFFLHLSCLLRRYLVSYKSTEFFTRLFFSFFGRLASPGERERERERESCQEPERFCVREKNTGRWILCKLLV
jgi:hypothetical protein